MDNVSMKKTNSVATNVMSAPSINRHSKKVRDLYILHTILLAVVLLSIIIIICNQNAKEKDIIQNGK